MRKNKFVFIFIVIAALFSVNGLIFYGAENVKAGSEHNTSGYAWSENIGWISFNNLTDGSSDSYGVNVDLNNDKLSGHAWSENIGWISFERSETGPPPSNDPCPDGTCIAKITPLGQLGKSNVYIKGWARALAGEDYDDGWDGWIRFDHGQSNESYIDVNGDWHGWAWGGEVVGWVSFNGADADAGGDYKVTLGQVNHPPTVSDFEVAKGDYCTAPAHYFSWTYSDPDGDNESRFQFQVDNNSDFSSPEVNRDYDGLSNPSPTTNNQTVVVAVSPTSDQIAYNTTYYWRVMVYDEEGMDSGWVEGLSFTTEEHQYPSVDFNWSPQEPSEEEDVLFADQSTVYGGAAKSAWSWSFEDGNPNSSAEQNPVIQFTDSGGKEVVLGVTDSDGYACSKSKIVDVQWSLPDWKEK
jgi:hypothetical protein